MKIPSLNGRKYFFLSMDDIILMIWVYFLKEKSWAFQKNFEFKALDENMSRYFIKTLRSHRGGELLSNKFDSFANMIELEDNRL